MTLSVKWAEVGPNKNGPATTTTYNIKGSAPSMRERQIKVAYADVETAIQECLGYSEVEYTSGGATKNRLLRTMPEFFPIADANKKFICTDVSVFQFGRWTGRKIFNPVTNTFGGLDASANADEYGSTDPKLNWYYDAWLKLTYTNPAYNSYMTDAEMSAAGFSRNESKRFCSFKYSQQAKYFSVPGATFQVQVSGTNYPVPFPVGVIEGKGTLTITWHCVAWDGVPVNTIRNAVGKVNSVAWTFREKTYPAGTLLCMAPQYNTYEMSNGKLGCDVIFTFEEFPPEHNKILYKSDDVLSYRWLITDGTTTTPTYGSLPAGKTLFGEVNFDDLFNVYLG